jgi:hypothetical protein
MQEMAAKFGILFAQKRRIPLQSRLEGWIAPIDIEEVRRDGAVCGISTPGPFPDCP